MIDRRAIVFVDDEPGLRGMVEDYLSFQGFAVRTAEGGPSLDALLRAGPADAIVLDVNMPGEDGIAIARRLRAGGSRAGILMLTALGDEDARVRALGLGADDYLTKPFALSELTARIRAVLRRMPEEAALPPRRAVRFGRCNLDLDGRRLLGPDGLEIGISMQEFELLSVFARHPRQVMARDRLCELAHNRPLEAGERSVDVRITRLRGKIEADPSDPLVLRTVRGEGYVFEPAECKAQGN